MAERDQLMCELDKLRDQVSVNTGKRTWEYGILLACFTRNLKKSSIRGIILLLQWISEGWNLSHPKTIPLEIKCSEIYVGGLR